jgi:hypothetical protein
MAGRMKAIHVRIVIGAVILLAAGAVWWYGISFGPELAARQH